ncbi:MAG: Uma2 family endonuclease [Rhizobacter sp.]|nr:Uma2 family endonuclease [Chlorobiales bacterium]
MQTLTKPVTYDDYRKSRADDNFLYELLGGELVRKSAPTLEHQFISRNLFRKMDAFAAAGKLGEVLYAPVDVFIDEHNTPQPEILFVAAKNLAFITPDGVFGPPDLVVEIISPGSIVRDRVDKMRRYQKFGIAEYWMIDPQNKSVEVYQNTAEGYNIFSFAAESGKVNSRVLETFAVDLAEFFA